MKNSFPDVVLLSIPSFFERLRVILWDIYPHPKFHFVTRIIERPGPRPGLPKTTKLKTKRERSKEAGSLAL